MASSSSLPAARSLALLALVLAAGVFCLRAADLLTTKAPVNPTGNAKERALVSLLEPVAGPGNVRVSITGTSARHYLVLVNSPRAETPETARLRADIGNILPAATGFDASRDQLTITLLPFAPAAIMAPPPRDWAELAGLGLLMACLTLVLLRPSESTSTQLPTRADDLRINPRPLRAREPSADISTPDTIISTAGSLAAREPEATVSLIRQWMSTGKGGSA